MRNAIRNSTMAFIVLFGVTTTVGATPITSDLELWLDASNPSSIVPQGGGSVVDGGRVREWHDILVGNNASADNATQTVATGAQPTWIASVPGLGGKSAVRFTKYQIMDLATLTIGSDASAFFVLENIDQGGGGSIHRSVLAADNNPYRGDGDGFGFGYRRAGSDGFVVSLGNGTSEQTVQASFSPSGNHEIMSYTKSGTQGTLFRDGSQIAAGTQDRTSGFHTDYGLGRQPGDATRAYQGDMAEVLIYNQALSAPQRKSVENYLKLKFGMLEPTDAVIREGLTLHLDGDHVTTDTSGNVESWDNRAGAGLSAIQTDSTKRPAAVSAELNGHGVVRFDGSNDVLHIADLLIERENTVFIISKNSTQNAGGSYHRGVLTADNNPYQSTGDGYAFGYHRDGADGFQVSHGGGSAGGGEQAISNSLGDNDQFEIISFRKDTAGFGEMFRDGTSKGTRTFVDPTPGYHTGYNVGADSNDGSRYYLGDLAEIRVYDRTLTVAKHDEAGYHLAKKYGISTTFGVVRADIDAHQLVRTKDVTAYGNDAAKSSTLEMGNQGWGFTGGAEQRLTIADDSSLGLVDQDFTLEFWADPDFGNFGGKSRLLLDTRGSGGGLLVGLGAGRNVAMHMSDGAANSGNKYSTGLVANDDDMHHIALVVDYGATPGAGNVLFYIDGSPAGTAAFTGLTGSIDASGPWTIGNHAAGIGTSWESFMGEINLFRTYAQGLTPGEVLESYNAGFGLPVPEPSAFALLAVGLFGLLGCARRRGGRKQK